MLWLVGCLVGRYVGWLVVCLFCNQLYLSCCRSSSGGHIQDPIPVRQSPAKPCGPPPSNGSSRLVGGVLVNLLVICPRPAGLTQPANRSRCTAPRRIYAHSTKAKHTPLHVLGPCLVILCPNNADPRPDPGSRRQSYPPGSTYTCMHSINLPVRTSMRLGWQMDG